MSARQNSSAKTPISIIPSGPLITNVSEKVSPAAGLPTDAVPVRRSTREIKRKKFDDDVIVDDAALPKSRKARPSIADIADPLADPSLTISVTITNIIESLSDSPAPVFLPAAPAVPGTPVATTAIVSKSELKLLPSPLYTSTPVPTPPLVPSPVTVAAVIAPLQQVPKPQSSKKKSKSNNKKPPLPIVEEPTNEQLQEQAAALKDVGRWQPVDDLALITAVMQTSDLKAVYTGVKFTCKFTLQEIAERWYALLYDPMISRLAQDAMRQLPPDLALSVQSNTLFHRNEERLLAAYPSTVTPTMDLFKDLLQKHPENFHPARSAKSLYQHWLHMRQYRLLPDQKPLPMPPGDFVMNFSDLEENFSESDSQPTDPITEREIILAERQLTRQIRRLENELPKWHVLVECATGVATPDFDQNTVAVLRGRLVRYLMRSREVSLGRNGRGFQVDIDLSLEGPAFKISRKQATIRLRDNGDFYIFNEGKRPIYIDGKPILPSSKGKLNNNNVIEIACLRLLFLINLEQINTLKSEAAAKRNSN